MGDLVLWQEQRAAIDHGSMGGCSCWASGIPARIAVVWPCSSRSKLTVARLAGATAVRMYRRSWQRSGLGVLSQSHCRSLAQLAADDDAGRPWFMHRGEHDGTPCAPYYRA